MKHIALVSCASKKQNRKTQAKYLYTSPLFKLNLRYANAGGHDKIYILSAKYGLLDLAKEVDPYEKTLNKMSSQEVKLWAEGVLEQLREVANLDEDEFMFLAGKRYRMFLTPYLKKWKAPLEGLGIGKQLKWLKEHTK